jgi:hypothetical protein
MLHFIKVFKDILDDGLNDVIYVKIKVILMIASFIWGIIILQHSEIILFYQENYPKIYTSFVNYFIMSSISILDIVYKIINFIYLKNKKKSTNTDYEILLKINDELNDELNKTIIEIPQIQ